MTSYTPAISVFFVKTLPNAVAPIQATERSVGYDLVAVAKVKDINSGTIMYDTGIIVIPPAGFYTEIVARSSLVKSGWILSNSVGIIDPDYTGSLRICLTRVVEGSPEPDLPFKLCQLILRRAEYAV